MRAIGLAIWRFMVIFSFIVNIVLVVVLIAAGVFIFQIKNNIADPLIGGLHSTAAGLEEATIDWTIPVRDRIPVNLDIQLTTDTVVILNEPVPLSVDAVIDLPGLNATNVPARVNITLPVGLELPVALDVPVPVREELDVSLDVRAVIPLSETQLADPIQTLGLLFEPLAVGLHNLPSNWNEAADFAGIVVAPFTGGNSVDYEHLLLAEDGTGFNPEAYDAWAGYGLTAGLNYDLLDQPVPQGNQAVETGIVPPGGIPFLDSLLRPQYWGDTSPAEINETAVADLEARNFPSEVYDGSMGGHYVEVQSNIAEQQPATTNGGDSGIIQPTPVTGGDSGIIQQTPVPPVGGTDAQSSQNNDDLGIISTPTTP